MDIICWSVRLFSFRGGDGVNGMDREDFLFKPARGFTLLEKMIIMCKNQGIINPF